MLGFSKSKPKEPKTRITLEMSTPTYKKLEAAAKASNITLDDFMRRSFGVYMHLAEQHRAGGVVLIENLDGTESEITF